MSIRLATRRDVLTALASAGLAAVGAPLINRGRSRLSGASPSTLLGAGAREYSVRAVDLVRRATVIDMLSPLTLDFPKFGRWMSDPDAFTPDDLTVTLEDRQLTVAGKRGDGAKADAFLHRGIAARGFIRSFVLADGLEVSGALLEHGLLHIDLARPEPEKLVKRIPIRTAG